MRGVTQVYLWLSSKRKAVLEEIEETSQRNGFQNLRQRQLSPQKGIERWNSIYLLVRRRSNVYRRQGGSDESSQ